MLNLLTQENIIQISVKHRATSFSDLKSGALPIKFAWIEITTKCNLKCVHCYNESDIHCAEEMSISDYKDVIDSLVNLGVKNIQLIGGEPFVVSNEKLTAMLDYSVNKFESIEIFTNGTLLSSMWFEYFVKHRIKIALSVYSYESSMHDLVTGQTGSWDKTNQVIKELRKFGIEYRVCNVLMKNISLGAKKESLYELSEKKDIIRMSGRASFSLLTDDLIKQRLITKEHFQKPLRPTLCQRNCSGHNCFLNKIYISANKTVYPCVMERRISHCQISDDHKINLQDDILSLNKDRINGCKDCEFRYVCFDCRPDSLSGGLYDKPWYCTYHPENGVWDDVDSFISELKKTWSR